MRDFSKKNQITSARRNMNKLVDSKLNSQSSRTLRKVILLSLLLMLLIAFTSSFYSKKSSKNAPTIETVSISSKNFPDIVTYTLNPDINPTLKNQQNMATIMENIKPNFTLKFFSHNETKNKNTIKISDQDSKDMPLIFTFYNTLTNKTVQVDANHEKLKKYRYTYMLQVGSYRNQSDVNAIRETLILAGFQPIIKKFGGWYRLDVGPVYSQRDGDVFKHKIETLGISGAILRQVYKQEIIDSISYNNE